MFCSCHRKSNVHFRIISKSDPLALSIFRPNIQIWKSSTLNTYRCLWFAIKFFRLDSHFRWLLQDMNQPWLDFGKKYCNSICRKDTALGNVWGTVRPCSHTTLFQRQLYNDIKNLYTKIYTNLNTKKFNSKFIWSSRREEECFFYALRLDSHLFSKRLFLFVLMKVD